jgi:hypothetical protein
VVCVPEGRFVIEQAPISDNKGVERGGGLDVESIHVPVGGRAPGWDAGIVVARR